MAKLPRESERKRRETREPLFFGSTIFILFVCVCCFTLDLDSFVLSCFRVVFFVCLFIFWISIVCLLLFCLCLFVRIYYFYFIWFAVFFGGCVFLLDLFFAFGWDFNHAVL